MLCFAGEILKMNSKQLNILLAEDDQDDREFFDMALKEIPIPTNLTTVNDGEQLMDYLYKNSGHLPNVLFLDLNMPRKNGFECLCEIKEDEMLKDILVVMFSTSYPRDIHYENDMINRLLKIGAHDFIRKSNNLSQLKEFIHQVIVRIAEKNQVKKLCNA
jgi:CheY-like chemotaxis protein